MRAALMYGAGDVRVESVPNPTIQESTDAIVRIVAGCICGSDLWPYASKPGTAEGARMGHEFVGIIEDLGSEVTGLSVGDFVIAPFVASDGTCDFCKEGLQTSCRHGAHWGGDGDGGQGEFARVPQAEGTLVVVPTGFDEKGEEGIAKVRELTDGDGTQAVLEAVGLKPAIEMAIGVVRDGGTISRVGAPQFAEVPLGFGEFMRNITLTGGVAPARAYIGELLRSYSRAPSNPAESSTAPSAWMTSRPATELWPTAKHSKYSSAPNEEDQDPMDITLNNGVVMPALGLGVFQSPPDQTTAAVQTALEVGYRHIDTAAAYGNEREVGEGIRRSGVDRSEVFIETKVWVSDYGHDETLHAWEKAAGKLGVDQLDLLILHQPAPDRFAKTIAAFKALEVLLADGRVRAIGVSNFMPHHLEQLLAEAEVVPAVNQVELHPYFQQPEVQSMDAKHGILTQAWSPIGGITFYPGWGENRKNVMRDRTVAAVAQAHGKTPAQVMLRWHLQQGRSAIPKSTNPARIAENFDVFDFELDTAELAAIDALDTGIRSGPDPDVARPERFAMVIPEA